MATTSATQFTFLGVTMLFHIMNGMGYFFQPLLQRRFLVGAEARQVTDPIGLLSFKYFWSQSVPLAEEYAERISVILYLRTAGFLMLLVAARLFYHMVVVDERSASDMLRPLGFLHLMYAVICVGGFRNQWASIDYLWFSFCFHMLMTLALWRLRRRKSKAAAADQELDEEYDSTYVDNSTDEDDSDIYDDHSPELSTSWSVDSDYVEDGNQDEIVQDDDENRGYASDD